MLAGPKVSRLLPFLQQRGFVGDAFASGKQALEHLRRSPCHVLCIEIELGDMMGVDLARTGKQEGIVGATLLLEDPIKSGMVISALARGIEAFVPVPPDETLLMERLESLLLAQWGLAVTGQQQQLTAEVTRLQGALDLEQEQGRLAAEHLESFRKTASRDLTDERKKVQELVREIASLRDQLATMHLVTGAKSGNSNEGRAASSAEGLGVDDDGNDDVTSEFGDEATVSIPLSVAAAMIQQEQATLERPRPAPPRPTPSIDDFDFENEATPAGSAPLIPKSASFANNDEDTAPGGHQLPSQLSVEQQKKRKSTTTTANLDIEMLKDLARIPTAGDEEIVFVDDD